MGCRRLTYPCRVAPQWVEAVPVDVVYDRAVAAGREAFVAGYRPHSALACGGFMDGWRLACAAAAEAMLDELATSALEVAVIVPPGRVNGIRVAVERNVDWYRDLCARYPSTARSRSRRRRHVDSLIKRAHVHRALRELARGYCVTEYARRLVLIVQAYAGGAYAADGCEPTPVDRTTEILAYPDGAGEAF